MSKHVLVPLDGSAAATEAVAFVYEQFPEATVTFLHVINPSRAGYGAQAGIPSFSEEWYEDAEAAADDLFEEARAGAPDGIDIRTEVEVGQPSRHIVEYADEHDIDQIVMGSHGRDGVSRILLGSVAETVVRRAHVPVTVVR